MASWIEQTFHYGPLTLELKTDTVTLTASVQGHPPSIISIKPSKQQEAHDMALLLRKAARRFEEIGKGLK